MMEAAAQQFDIIWEPQAGPQLQAISCPCDEIFFGGSRGGGKTDTAIGRQIDGALTHGYKWNGLFVRKNFKHFAELRRRIDELIRMGMPAVRTGGDTQTNFVKFDNGGMITLTAIERAELLDFFQGQQFVEISIEEATQFNFLIEMIDKLKGCMRSPHGIRCQMFLTGNPGGPGHHAVKARYIDPVPARTVIRDPISDETRVFIPSNVEDNKILCEKDPRYLNRLKGITDPVLRKAWYEGDWDVVMGGFFDDVWNRHKHVLPMFKPPRHWTRIMGFDWGSARPFSVGWYAISDGSYNPIIKKILPRGAIVRYAEWYGCEKGMPNVGLRMNSVDVAKEIILRETKRNEQLLSFDRIADPAVFITQDGPPISEKMAINGVHFRPGDNKRIAGWDECRVRLAGTEDDGPMFYVTENCVDFIRTVPSLERDDRDWEDIDTDNEDHIGDEWRYVLMSRQGKGKLKSDGDRPGGKTEAQKDWDNILGNMNDSAINMEA